LPKQVFQGLDCFRARQHGSMLPRKFEDRLRNFGVPAVPYSLPTSESSGYGRFANRLG
jgi:hypothetical protein